MRVIFEFFIQSDSGKVVGHYFNRWCMQLLFEDILQLHYHFERLGVQIGARVVEKY